MAERARHADRGQNLSPLQQVEAVRIFDEPFDHPKWVHRHEESRLVYTFNLAKAGTASHCSAPGTSTGRWPSPLRISEHE